MCQATNCQGPANPSWQGMHKADIVLSQTLHQKKKLYSHGQTFSLFCDTIPLRPCPPWARGNLISFLIVSRKSPSTILNAQFPGCEWGDVLLSSPPQTGRNCFRKLSNENLRETEGNFTFSWFIPLSFWFFTRSMHYFAIIIKRRSRRNEFTAPFHIKSLL